MTIIFLFSGITAPLVARYTAQLIARLGGPVVVAGDSQPGWRELLQAYDKNASQLVLLLATYLVGAACAVGTDRSLGLFYSSRASSAFRIFGPRLVVSIGVSVFAAIVGAAAAIYETWALTDDLDLGRALFSMTVQIFSISAFCVVGGVIAAWTNAPFVSALVVEAIAFAGSLLSGADGFRQWSPTALLSPTALMNQNPRWDNLGCAVIVTVIVVIAAVASLGFRPIRATAREPKSASKETVMSESHA